MSTQKSCVESCRQGIVPTMTRRQILAGMAGVAAAAIAGVSVPATASAALERVIKKGRINQSVCKWPYSEQGLTLDQICAAAAKLGIKSVELLSPDELPTVKKYGLVCGMVNSYNDKSLTRGLNNKAYHAECIASLRISIDAAAEYGFPNVIALTGNRDGIPDDVGLENAVIAFKQIIGYAEKKKVTLCIENFNSKINHPDYMFDHLSWGIELCDKIGSERLKILYDVYHAQIMEGDIIRTIRTYKDYITHYQVGGNPGRHELDETQELYFPAILRAIVETGFTGYVGHEYVPTTPDPLTSMAQAARICDV